MAILYYYQAWCGVLIGKRETEWFPLGFFVDRITCEVLNGWTLLGENFMTQLSGFLDSTV